MIIDELIAILGYNIQGEAELGRFNRGIDMAEKNARRASAAINAMSVAVGTFVGTVAYELAGRLADVATSFPKDVINTSAMFEGFETSLTTIEGSAEKARSSMDWITDFAAKTPYELAGVTDAFIKLKAYGIDPVDGTLTMLGDTASAMNKPLNQAVEAFADATNFQFERLREFGLTASQKGNQVTFQWTKNGKQLTQVVKKNGAEIQKFLKDHFGSTFNGAMIRQSKTWNGMVSNLSDTWQLFQKKVGDAGFFDAMKGRLADLMDRIGKLGDDGTLQRWAANISNGLTSAVDGVVYMIDRLRRHFSFLSKFASANPELLKGLAKALGAIAIIRFPYLGSLLIIEDILSWLEGSESVIGNFADSLSKLTGIDADKIGALIATLGGFATLGLATGGLTAFAGGLWPLVAALTALAGAYYLAQAALEYFDSKVDKVKAVENPKTKPGYIEPQNEDTTGLNSNNPDQFLKPTDYGTDFQDAKAAAEREEADRLIREGKLDAKGGIPNREAANRNYPRNMGKDYIASDVRFADVDKDQAADRPAASPAPVAAAAATGDVNDLRGSLSFLFDKRFWIGDAADGKSIRDALAVDVGSGALDSGGGADTARTPDLTPLYDLMGKMKAGAESLLGPNIMGALSNMNANLAKMTGDAMAKQVNATITDARQDNRNQSTNLGAISVVVNGVSNVSEAVGRQVGAAVQSGAARGVAGARPARIEGSN